MQAIMETIFDAIYLVTVIAAGIIMMTKSKENKQYKLFGIMAFLLGAGDSFHLLPRIYALFTTGLEANANILGFGKLVTSITMTIFYVLLYLIWRTRYDIKGHTSLSALIFTLAVTRTVLCLFPQNDWFNYNAPVLWGIYRNIPFAIMGIIIIYLFYTQSKQANDNSFKFIWLAVTLSFAFYIPVVLWAETYRFVGILMIPKTIAYAWIVLMGYKEYKKSYIAA